MTEIIYGTCVGDFDSRIAAAFSDTVKSSDVSALIAEAEGASRLQSAEQIARGIGSWRVGAADVVRITEEL
jgi:hypothetical protein